MNENAMDLRKLLAPVLKAAVILGGVLPFAAVIYLRRYDAITMLVRLRRLRLADPDGLWIILVLGLAITYVASLRSAWQAARHAVGGGSEGGALKLVYGALSSAALLFALNAVLDAYGWKVQI